MSPAGKHVWVERPTKITVDEDLEADLPRLNMMSQ